MKEKIIFIIDKIAAGIVFVIVVSTALLILTSSIYLLIKYPIRVILAFFMLFIAGYISEKFNIIK